MPLSLDLRRFLGAAVAAPIIHLGRVRLFGEDRHSRYAVLKCVKRRPYGSVQRDHLAVD